MVECIQSTTQKARKVYNDDGWEFIKQWMDDGCWVEKGYPKPTFSELRVLVMHKNKPRPFKIEIGEIYERQFNKMDGDVYTYRMNKQLFEIAAKFDLFPTDF